MLAYEYVTSAERLGAIANEVRASPVVALDLETTPKPQYRHIPTAALNPHLGRARLCSLNTGRGVYVIDLFRTGGYGPLADALHNPNQETAQRPVIVGQNVKFDQAYLLHEAGIELWPVFDTMRASGLLYNGKFKGHGLYDLYARELKMAPQAPDLGGSNWGADVLTKDQLDYAAEDVVWLPRLREVLRPKLQAAGLFRVALIEFGAVLPEAAVELNGFPFDPEAWQDLARTTRAEAHKRASELLRMLPNPRGQLMLPGAADWMFGPDVLEAWALSEAPEEDDPDPEHGGLHAAMRGDRDALHFNLAVREQLARAMKPKGSKDKLHFNLDSTEQMLSSLRMLGGPLRALESTRETALAMFAAEIPVIGKLLKYREFATRLKSFGPDYLAWINPATGRIHPSYYGMLAAGRYSCSRPNLAQIPRDKAYRKCFRVRKGKRLAVADYGAIELRLIAQVSGDPTLLQVFQAGKDPHKATASIITGKAEADVTKDERQQAKPANFGFCLVAGTEVMTRAGCRPIETVGVGDEVLTHRGRWRPVTATQELRASRLLRITTRTGRVVTCTPDHMWRVLFPSANGRPPRCGWVEAQELREGDYLVHHGEGYEGSAATVGADLARLAGWYIAEGSYSSKAGLRIPQSMEANPDVCGAMRQRLGALGFTEWKDGAIARFYLPAGVHDQLRGLGLDLSQRSADKRLPAAVFGWSRAERLELLAGLWDGDGTMPQAASGKINLGYYSKSRGLLDDVRRLLDSVGIDATIYGGYDSAPEMGVVHVVGSAGRRRFLSDVPSVKVGRVDYQPKRLVLADERVVAIEPLAHHGEVFDLTVAEDHSFVANGLVTHNCYGMMPDKFLLYAMTNYGVHLTPKQAKDFRDKYFEHYQGIARWHQRALAEGKQSRIVRTPLGRLRHLDEDAHNEILNTPIQGAGADGLKIALREVYFRLKPYGAAARMIHHVHDEILVEMEDDPQLCAEIPKVLAEGMKIAMEQILTRVPVEVEPGVGETWADK